MGWYGMIRETGLKMVQNNVGLNIENPHSPGVALARAGGRGGRARVLSSGLGPSEIKW